MKTAAKKARLDQYLVEHGLCESRERAQALILAGAVEVNGQIEKKAGAPVREGAQVALHADPLPYVSRGGLKLRHALSHFPGLAEAVRGASALDVGASTGGFTDCLLQAGAARVCAVDVGYGQLAWKLRTDPRVTVLERLNARHLTPADLPFPPDLAVCDVSFISQTLLLSPICAVLQPGKWIVTLVKPQFEVGKEQVGKGGVVRDPLLHEAAIARCRDAALALRCEIIGVVPSPIQGPAGNTEFLLALRSPLS
jgi:23S rRNA (cytidine1920-2'-O)/16S rRNA (cytidine1409-2'-O)-methyltransferase